MQYFAGPARQQVPVVDHVPPTFAGISGLVANPNGSLSAAFTPAVDVTPPLRYRAYIQAATATGLFDAANRVYEGFASPLVLFTLPGGVLLHEGTVYHVGVRAVDGLGNEDYNTASLSATSEGVLTDNALTLANALTAATGNMITTKDDLVVAKDDIVGATADLVGVKTDLQQAVLDVQGAANDVVAAANSMGAQLVLLQAVTDELTADITALDSPGLIQVKNDLLAATATIDARVATLDGDLVTLAEVSNQLHDDIAAIDASALQQVAQELTVLTHALGVLEAQLESGVQNLGDLNVTLNQLNSDLAANVAHFDEQLVQFQNALDRLILTLPEEPELCVLEGNIRNISGRVAVWEKVEILIRPLTLPQVGGSSLLCTQPTHWFTDYNGDFKIPVVKGTKVLIEIPLCGVRFQYDVPVDKDLVDLVDVIMNLP